MLGKLIEINKTENFFTDFDEKIERGIHFPQIRLKPLILTIRDNINRAENRLIDQQPDTLKDKILLFGGATEKAVQKSTELFKGT